MSPSTSPKESFINVYMDITKGIVHQHLHHITKESFTNVYIGITKESFTNVYIVYIVITKELFTNVYIPITKESFTNVYIVINKRSFADIFRHQ